MMENKFRIRQKVMTPDGAGIVSSIGESYCGGLLYGCLLERPYKVTDPYQGTREYFPAYSFGYDYPESELEEL